MIKDGEVIIVDEFTGRMMPGRRWSDGLHQAVEAKEGVRIERENQTLATITFQNYFRMYDKLAGMTGTAETEAEEFAKIYKLDVTVVPTNRSLIRVNAPDVVYKTEREKFNAVVEDIIVRHQAGQPVLVGTVSIEKSEQLAALLKKRGIRHSAQRQVSSARRRSSPRPAARSGTVPPTWPAAAQASCWAAADFLSKEILRRGRGPRAARPTCGPSLEEGRRVTKPERPGGGHGGLHIVAPSSRIARIDNQRGAAPAVRAIQLSRFYLSLEDDLHGSSAPTRIQKIMDRLGMEEGQAIEHRLVTQTIATAQSGGDHSFEIRKHLLEYDDVMSEQRGSSTACGARSWTGGRPRP